MPNEKDAPPPDGAKNLPEPIQPLSDSGAVIIERRTPTQIIARFRDYPECGVSVIWNVHWVTWGKFEGIRLRFARRDGLHGCTVYGEHERFFEVEEVDRWFEERRKEVMEHGAWKPLLSEVQDEG